MLKTLNSILIDRGRWFTSDVKCANPLLEYHALDEALLEMEVMDSGGGELVQYCGPQILSSVSFKIFLMFWLSVV